MGTSWAEAVDEKRQTARTATIEMRDYFIMLMGCRW
jgi:hypothetical protein